MPRRAAGFERELERLGAEVARRRTLLGLTQPALADRAGISLDGLLSIEKGRSAPSTVTLIQVAQALACPAAAILAVVDEPRARRTKRDSGIADLLEGQPDDVVAAAEACVRAVVKLGTGRRG